jgi:hypothetical protein
LAQSDIGRRFSALRVDLEGVCLVDEGPRGPRSRPLDIPILAPKITLGGQLGLHLVARLGVSGPPIDKYSVKGVSGRVKFLMDDRIPCQ